MGTPPRINGKTSKSRGKNGKPKSLTEGINEQVNAAEEKVQEIEKTSKPKKENFSSDKSEDSLDFSEKEKAETMKIILERFPSKPVKGPIPKMHLGYGDSKGHQAELAEKRKLREAWNNTVEAESKNSAKPEKQQESVKNENESTKEATTTADPEYVLKQLEAAKKKIDELSKVNQSLRNTNNVLNESIKQRAEEDARKSQETVNEEPKAEEVKTDNSGTTKETATPEGEAKVEGEPKANTEQAQATQEPTKETNARPGTGEAIKDNVMSPEDAFKFFNDKKNYERASTVFKTPSFDEYIDSTTGKWIPRSYFDAFNARDGIDPKKFTFEHFKAKIPEDPGKPLTAEEKTADLYNKTKAEEDYEKEYENYNTGFKAYLRKHPKLSKLIKGGGALGILYGIGQMFNDAYTAGQNDKDELQNIIDGLNDDDPEYLGSSSGNNSPENIAEKLKGADESTETPEGDSGTIEQAIAEQAPAGNVEPENPQVASNAATPASTKANSAESAPTQGLPPVVTRNTPSTNPDLGGMTYSQRVEAAGQAPQAESMAYNANNPDMVTANLINAMNQAPQAGSDAIGYGDLYDQNFIDFWAKRNPNLAFGVSQGRR